MYLYYNSFAQYLVQLVPRQCVTVILLHVSEEVLLSEQRLVPILNGYVPISVPIGFGASSWLPSPTAAAALQPATYR
jgi:hypothetical protein